MPTPCQNGGWAIPFEVASAAMCSFIKQPGMVKPILLLRLLCPKIVERYPDGPEF